MASRGKKKQIKGEALDKINTPVFKDEAERLEFWHDYIAALYLVKLAGCDPDNIDENKINDYWNIWDCGYSFMEVFSKSESISDFKDKICEFIDNTCAFPSTEGGD